MAQRMTGSAAWRRYRSTKIVEKRARISPQSKIDPARADHSPVMEYRRGVTALLFSATNTSAKSWVTSACSMAPVASSAPASITGAIQRPSPNRDPGLGVAGAACPLPVPSTVVPPGST